MQQSVIGYKVSQFSAKKHRSIGRPQESEILTEIGATA